MTEPTGISGHSENFQQKYRPLATGLAFFFLLLMLATLGARFWLGGKANEFVGPVHIAAGEEFVYLYAAGDIVQLNHAGELQAVHSAAQTALKDVPIDLRVLADGRLLIAEQRPARIRLCRVGGWICHPVAAPAASIIERQFKLLPGERPDQWLVSDARGDMLWRLPADGGESQALVSAGTLVGPNDLVFGDDGHLWIADTDHRRILELLPAGDGTFAPGREHSAVNRLTVGQRFYPAMLTRSPDGRLWVTQGSEFSEPHSDLVIYDPEEGVLNRVELPPRAYATDVVSLDETTLVTDMDRYTVYRIDHQNLTVQTFGNRLFHEHLANSLKQRRTYGRLETLSLAAVILFASLMILAAALATPRNRWWTRPPVVFDLSNAPEAVPRTSGIHWLAREPKIDLTLKWLERLGYLMFTAMVFAGFALYQWGRTRLGADKTSGLESELSELGVIILLGVLLLALLIFVTRYSVKSMQTQLGTDGRRVCIRLADGRELYVEPMHLAFNDRLILYRQHAIPLRAGKRGAIYRPEELQTWLAPLLRDARELSELQVLKHQWKHHGSRITIWAVLALLAFSIMIFMASRIGAAAGLLTPPG